MNADGEQHLAAGLAALRADPMLARLIDELGPIDLWAWRTRWPRDPFALLVRTIVGQQISTGAANAIFSRLQTLAGEGLSAACVARRSDTELLTAGLSRAKLAALRDLSARVQAGQIDLNALRGLPDEEIRRQLMTVRGIGPWTTELFLLALGRDDALPSADVGLRRAVQTAYDLPALPTAADVEALGQGWRPFRSLAALYLYTSLRRPPA
jgi:DNA-3-methyladenine glycosylase II